MSALTSQIFTPRVAWRAFAWRAVAWCGLGLGAAGALLPLLPTTPFLLIAAWAAPKGSPGLNSWLHAHPTLGPPIRAWRDRRAVPLRAKCMASLLLISSWIGLWTINAGMMVLSLTTVLFCGVTVFICTRPNAGESNE